MSRVQTASFDFNGKKYSGVSVSLGRAPLLLISSDEHPSCYLACGYWSIDTSNHLGDCTAIARGVHNFEALLHAEVKELSVEARRRGAKIGMDAREFLEKMG